MIFFFFFIFLSLLNFLSGGRRVIFLLILRVSSTLFVRKRNFILREAFSKISTFVIKSLLSCNKRNLQAKGVFFSAFFFLLVSNWIGLFPFLSHNFLNKLRVSIILLSLTFWLFSYSPFLRVKKEKITLFIIGEIKFPVLSFLLSNIEILTHLFRPVTLSARLWVNIWVGHLILSVFSVYRMELFSYHRLDFPKTVFYMGIFFCFETGIMFLQTFVFTYLAKVYFEENLEHRQS